jgi:dTDP-4-amino-4,6-dideoxygalactose transaminase
MRWPYYAEDERAAVQRVLESGDVNYWSGHEGRKFEEEFAEYCNSDYALALANGTAALELALEAAGIGRGDEVVVTPRTFIASASCVVRVGARPVFADVSGETQNIEADAVRSVLTPGTRAIIAVHHAGWPCDMDPLLALADEYGLLLFEDCAQAHGAKYKGRPVGGMGHAAAFSFCQDKIITTGGEGGMVVTNDKDIWNRAWSIKDHGKSYDAVFSERHPPGFRWVHESFGTNMRLTEMQAAIGRVQLTKLDEWSAQRNRNAARLREALSSFPSVRVPVPADDIWHAYYRLYAFVEPDYLAEGWSRDRIMTEINRLGVPCFSGSCPEIYNERAFERAALSPGRPLPEAHRLGATSLAFLVHPSLTSADIDHGCDVITRVFSAATG